MPTLLGARGLLSRLLLGLLGFLQGSQLGLVNLLQRVPLLTVVQQAVQHGRDLHVEAAELLRTSRRKSDQMGSMPLPAASVNVYQSAIK